jgi:predicted dehydrogenase
MKPINRRDFIGAAAIAASGSAVSAQQRRGTNPPAPSPQARAKDPNRRLGIGLIGCGWYGMVDLKAALQVGGINVVALCDIDSEHLVKSAAEVGKLQTAAPKTFKDYRQLLEVPGLEAVIIATPPHWHALQFIAACQKGLDIYCEKPLSYDLREGRAMVHAAQLARNIVQIGFQRRNSMASTQAADYIRGGYPGRIVQVEARINYSAKPADTTVQAPPASLDWDAWCGPAPKLPYSPNIGHISWRLEAAYGNGHLVDWGIHWIDGIRRILGASIPKSVQAMGGIYELKGKISTPDVLTALFDFEECPVVWTHRLWGAAELDPTLSNCALF